MPRRASFTALPALVTVLWACVLAACTPAPVRDAEAPPRVWPQDADLPPRVAYVNAFARPEEFGIAKAFLDRVGEFLFGERDLRLVRPMAVVAVGETVYVADPGAKGVHRFDPVAGRHDLIGGEGGTPLPSPVALAVGRDGEVYVADSVRAAVLVIRRGADAAVALPLPTLGQPTGVAFDRARGRLYVVDTTAHRVAAFAPDGSLAASIGRRGENDGEFNYPTYLWCDARGRLYVTDSLNFRIQVFDTEGRFVGKFGKAGDGTGDFMRQKGVATDRFGHVYIVDALLNALQIFDDAGRLLLSIGSLGRDRGEFWLPAGIFIGDDDRIWVADAYNRRIQVFRYVGGGS